MLNFKRLKVSISAFFTTVLYALHDEKPYFVAEKNPLEFSTDNINKSLRLNIKVLIYHVVNAKISSFNTFSVALMSWNTPFSPPRVMSFRTTNSPVGWLLSWPKLVLYFALRRQSCHVLSFSSCSFLLPLLSVVDLILKSHFILFLKSTRIQWCKLLKGQATKLSAFVYLVCGEYSCQYKLKNV